MIGNRDKESHMPAERDCTFWKSSANASLPFTSSYCTHHRAVSALTVSKRNQAFRVAHGRCQQQTRDVGGSRPHLVHVQAVVRERKGNLASAHGLRQHLPRLPLRLIDLVVHEVPEARVLAAHQQLRRAVRPKLLRRQQPKRITYRSSGARDQNSRLKVMPCRGNSAYDNEIGCSGWEVSPWATARRASPTGPSRA